MLLRRPRRVVQHTGLCQSAELIGWPTRQKSVLIAMTAIAAQRNRQPKFQPLSDWNRAVEWVNY